MLLAGSIFRSYALVCTMYCAGERGGGSVRLSCHRLIMLEVFKETLNKMTCLVERFVEIAPVAVGRGRDDGFEASDLKSVDYSCIGIIAIVCEQDISLSREN